MVKSKILTSLRGKTHLIIVKKKGVKKGVGTLTKGKKFHRNRTGEGTSEKNLMVHEVLGGGEGGKLKPKNSLALPGRKARRKTGNNMKRGLKEWSMG